MLDIKYVLENIEEVKQNIEARRMNVDVDAVINAYNDFKLTKKEIDDLRAESNTLAKTIANVTPEEREELKKQATEIKQKLQEKSGNLGPLEETFNELVMTLPNTLAPDTPIGHDENCNIELKRYGEPKVFDFEPKDHVTLGKDLDLIDFDAGAKTTGAKFYFLKNEAVLLELAIKQLAINIAIKNGFTPLKTPDLARNDILMGTGYNPRGRTSDVYRIQNEDISLIGTAEITVAGYHSDEIVPESNLPLLYVAESHCFRTEAGAAGKVSKGLYRVHQFEKIELFIFSKPEDSDQMLEKILQVEEKIYQALEIPYRVIRICSGDLGAPAYKKYDIEAWMPGKGENGDYGEITSASNCTDYQARRLNIRFKPKDSKKNIPVHTLNGTATALSRTLIALLENHQDKDGNIQIPKALQTYLQIPEIKSKKI